MSEKKLTKKQKIEKIKYLVAKMEKNNFLLPDSWSELCIMNSRNAYYKTYVGKRGNGRYINIDYTNGDKLYNPSAEDKYEIEFRNDNIFLKKRLGESKNEINIVLDIVQAIYKEKYSFEISDEKISEKRVELKELREKIKNDTKNFNKMKKYIEEANTIIKNNG